jgi:hypothetical protein
VPTQIWILLGQQSLCLERATLGSRFAIRASLRQLYYGFPMEDGIFHLGTAVIVTFSVWKT